MFSVYAGPNAPPPKGGSSTPADAREAAAHAQVRVLRHLRLMVAVLALVHVGLFILIVIGVFRIMRLIDYYQPYMSEPLSGPNMHDTVMNAELSVSAVKNLTTLLAGGTSVIFTNVGLAPSAQNGDYAPPPPTQRRLLAAAASDVGVAALLNCSQLQSSLAGLADALANNSRQFNASAPSDFLEWVVRTDWEAALGPYASQMFELLRYGEAVAGTFFKAMGTTVDPGIVGHRFTLRNHSNFTSSKP